MCLNVRYQTLIHKAMKKVTTLFLMLYLTLSGALCYASGLARTENEIRMEAIGEKASVGKRAQYIPVSREAYEAQVLYALSLLPHSEKESENGYPTDYWMDVVTEQPEGYVVDENGDVHLYSAEALAWLISVVNGLNGQEADNFDGKKVTLESNVDMSAARWISIAYGTNIGDPNPDRLKFCGNFDGNGFVINGLVLSNNPFYSGNYESFFGNLCGARIENVVLRHVYCEGRNDTDGKFFGNTEPLETGEETRQNVIDRCYFEIDEMNMSPQNLQSALFGYRNDGIITNCMVNCGKVSCPGSSCQELGLFVYYNHGNIENCASVVDSLNWLLQYSGIAVINYGLIENCYSFIDNWFGWECWWPPVPRLGVSAANYGTIRNCYYNTFKYEDASWNGSFFDDEPVSHNYGSIENTVPFEPTPYFQTPYWIFADTVSITSHTGFVYQTLQLEEALNDWVLGQENDADYLYWCADPFCLISVFPNHLPSFYDFDIAGTSENTANNDQVLLYPNPTTGMVTVTGENLQQAEVFNLLGQKLLGVKGKGSELHVDMTALPRGIYFVSVTDESGQKCVRKVMKE